MEQEQEYLKHFSPGITPDIEAYATDEVFEKSRYIFTYHGINDKQLYGYCTHCRHSFPIFRRKRKKHKTLEEILTEYDKSYVSYAHNSSVCCPFCSSFCIAKSDGMGRKNLIDEAYFVYYEKSLIDPDVIVARGFHAARDYSGGFRDVKTQYSVKALYIFQQGGSQMYRRNWTFNKNRELVWFYQKCSSIYPLFRDQWTADDRYYRTSMWQKIIPVSVSWDSIEAAVKDTLFRYSTYEDYLGDNDMVKFFALYSRYPCIEYLTKMGFGNLVEQKLAGERTYQAINWRGKNPLQVLKLSKTEIREIRDNEINVTFCFLHLIKYLKKKGMHLTLQEISEIDSAGYYTDQYRPAFESVLEHASVHQTLKYIKKQMEKKHYRTKTQALTAWRDYMADCTRLEMDLTQENVLFPGNLYQAHQNTIKQVIYIADQEMDKMIKAMLKVLNKRYSFEYNGLFIRPAGGTEELVNEGKVLNHCVGGYAKRYEKGETVILLLRKESEPMMPFYTVEIKGKSIIQCRGNRNCAPDQAVKEFMEAYKQKLEGKKPKNRIRIMVPA